MNSTDSQTQRVSEIQGIPQIRGGLRVAPHWKVGFVTSRFNETITTSLEIDAITHFLELGGQPEQLTRVTVPGAMEISMAARWLFEKGCGAIVILGAVIRGETSHYEMVCEGFLKGCLRVQEEMGHPIAFGVLTVESSKQAWDRLGGRKGHKGKEAVEALIEMLNLRNDVRGS